MQKQSCNVVTRVVSKWFAGVAGASLIAPGALLFATLGCSAADGEELGQAQEALLVSDQVLRLNASGKCVEEYNGGFRTVDCAYPYPTNKKWDFDGSTNSGFRVRNNAGHCITAALAASSGDQLWSTSCGYGNRDLWKVKPGSGSLAESTFQLYNLEHPTMCMTEEWYGLRIETCADSYPAIAKQRLLLDNF